MVNIINKYIFYRINFLSACIKHGTSQNRQTSVTCQNTELWSSESLSKIFEQWSTARVDLQEFASTPDSSYKVCMYVNIFN